MSALSIRPTKIWEEIAPLIRMLQTMHADARPAEGSFKFHHLLPGAEGRDAECFLHRFISPFPSHTVYGAGRASVRGGNEEEKR